MYVCPFSSLRPTDSKNIDLQTPKINFKLFAKKYFTKKIIFELGSQLHILLMYAVLCAIILNI